MIELKKNLLDDYPKAYFYGPSGDYLGCTNQEIVFNDFRVQIKKAQATGYYMVYEGVTIPFDRNGTPKEFPEPFELNIGYLLELV